MGGRFPSLAIQASWDSGYSWRLTIVDSCDTCTAQGTMIEVAPDVVYGAWGPPNNQGPVELRRQFIAVTTSGLRPAFSFLDAQAKVAALGSEHARGNQRRLHVKF